MSAMFCIVSVVENFQEDINSEAGSVHWRLMLKTRMVGDIIHRLAALEYYPHLLKPVKMLKATCYFLKGV